MIRLYALIGTIVAAIVGVLGFGASQRRQGRKQQEAKANAETLERLEEGRRAVVRDGDPDQRVRDNDGQWGGGMP